MNVNIAANAKGVTLGKYIDYQNAVDKTEQVHIITGKSSESIRLLQAHVIDEIINEPSGGAHRNYDAAAAFVKSSLIKSLQKFSSFNTNLVV